MIYFGKFSKIGKKNFNQYKTACRSSDSVRRFFNIAFFPFIRNIKTSQTTSSMMDYFIVSLLYTG